MPYLGADHRGFKLKEHLKSYLTDHGIAFEDFGTDSPEPIDYPLIAEKVAKAVTENPDNRGILICGNGAGVGIVANKLRGIRAAQAWAVAIAKSARNDDDINVLCLPADSLSEKEAELIVQQFLDTTFGKDARYQRRLEEIKRIEQEN